MAFKNFISFSYSATTGTTKSTSFVDSLSLSMVRAVPPQAISCARKFISLSQLSRVSSSLAPLIRYGLGEAIIHPTIFQVVSQENLYIYIQVSCIYSYNQKRGAGRCPYSCPFWCYLFTRLRQGFGAACPLRARPLIVRSNHGAAHFLDAAAMLFCCTLPFP